MFSIAGLREPQLGSRRRVINHPPLDSQRPPEISFTRASAWYTLVRASLMIVGSTAMARFFSTSNQYEPEIEWMLPSNIRPTNSPLALTSGLPELPPTMSLLVERLKRVLGSSALLASTQRGGMLKGFCPVVRS